MGRLVSIVSYSRLFLMIIASASTSRGAHVCLAWCLDSVLNVKVLVGAFNQEKALLGAFSVITKLRVDIRLKL